MTVYEALQKLTKRELKEYLDELQTESQLESERYGTISYVSDTFDKYWANDYRLLAMDSLAKDKEEYFKKTSMGIPIDSLMDCLEMVKKKKGGENIE